MDRESDWYRSLRVGQKVFGSKFLSLTGSMPSSSVARVVG